jgi:hypothetical protein
MWRFEVGPDDLPISGGKRRSHFEEDLDIAPLTSHFLHDRLSGVPARSRCTRSDRHSLRMRRREGYAALSAGRHWEPTEEYGAQYASGTARFGVIDRSIASLRARFGVVGPKQVNITRRNQPCRTLENGA